MKALILAAGEGTRLRPLTDDRPKCLVELHGQALLDHQLGAYAACGIHEVVAVTGYRGELVRRPGLRTYDNPDYARTNMVASLFCAEPELRGDVIVSYGDIVFEPRVLEALLAEPADFAVVVDDGWRDLWLLRMGDPLAGAETLKLNAAGCIRELGKVPASEADVESQYIGLFKISGRVIAAVRHFYHGLPRDRRYDGQPFERMYMTSFIQCVIDGLMPVRAVRIRHGWLELDTLEDLKRYTAMEPASERLFCFGAVR